MRLEDINKEILTASQLETNQIQAVYGSSFQSSILAVRFSGDIVRLENEEPAGAMLSCPTVIPPVISLVNFRNDMLESTIENLKYDLFIRELRSLGISQWEEDEDKCKMWIANLMITGSFITGWKTYVDALKPKIGNLNTLMSSLQQTEKEFTDTLVLGGVDQGFADVCEAISIKCKIYASVIKWFSMFQSAEESIGEIRADPHSYTPKDICLFLKSIDQAAYIPLFLNEKVTGETLLQLGDSELSQLGIKPLYDRKYLLYHIHRIKNGFSSTHEDQCPVCACDSFDMVESLLQEHDIKFELDLLRLFLLPEALKKTVGTLVRTKCLS